MHRYRQIFSKLRNARTTQIVAKWAPFSFTLPSLLSNLVLLGYFVAHAQKPGCGAPPLDPKGLGTYAYSFLSLNLLVTVILGAAAPSRVGRAPLVVSFNVVLVLLLGYHFAHRSPLDIDTLILNANNGLGDGVIEVIVDALGTSTLIVAGLLIASLSFANWRFDIFGQQAFGTLGVRNGLVALVAWSAIVFGTLDSREPVTYLARTAVDRVARSNRHATIPDTYPYITVSPAGPARTAPLPSIIVVMMESFNARYVAERNDQGAPVMPVFQSLIEQGMYWEWFYGNSIQTTKGHVATLLSVLPSTLGKIAVNYRTNCFQSIASVLKAHGYSTTFYQAYGNVQYEHGDEFYGRNGFDRVLSAEDTHGKPGPGEGWGWGLRDSAFYKELFRTLDQLEQERPHTPHFVAAAPVANHAPFDKMPPELRLMYPDASTRSEHYANSIHLSDADLQVFFDELGKRAYLENTIVVLTGDHSFPTGEHGYTMNVASFYEEFFRTPLLIIWPGHLEPKRISDSAHSQLDIAPTLIDLLGLSEVKHHFMGRSLLQAASPANPVFLIQPYSGRYLGVVTAPFKYVLHERSGQEFLFDLVSDPNEQHNLVGDARYASELTALRPLLQKVYMHEELLLQDRIWNCAQ